jgi:hypothetical protein
MRGFASRTPILIVAAMRHPLLIALLAVAGLAAIPAAQAADKPAAKPAVAPPAKTPLLSPAQLQACVTQKERLQAQTDDALKDKATIEAEKAEIARMGTSLAEELPTLDRTSEVAVNAYNAKVGERDKLIDSYQARVAAYNTKADAVKTTKESYEKQCENRRYDERDMEDLKRSKK